MGIHIDIHFVVILLIVAIIVTIQCSVFANTLKKIKRFRSIFPNKPVYKLKKESLIQAIKHANDNDLEKMLETSGYDVYNYMIVIKDDDGTEKLVFQRDIAIKDLCNNVSTTIEGIDPNHNNSTFITIVESINAYMENNKSVNDYHLMKDIVDRNCDSKEEEINTQIPIPLYLGLVGTMAGIIVGISFLWLGGGLSDLLTAGSGESNSAAGIEALLGGVALAMVSSILGIILTTTASNRFKSGKTQFENSKNMFFSWIQENLLPKLSDSVTGALRDMTGNLSEFNETFTNNVKGLDKALSKVNASYQQQTELMQIVQKIADKDLSVKNLQLFNALTNSAEQIETLGKYLKNSNEYLANVKALNENINMQEKRTKIMEDVGVFFKNEAEQIEERRGMMSKTVAIIDDYLKQALDKLKENVDKEFAELQKSSLQNQDVIKQKTEEMASLVDELHQLGDIKKGIAEFSKAMQTQNNRIEQLTSSINALAEANKANYDVMKSYQSKQETKPERKSGLKIAIVIGSIVLTAGIAALLVANWSDIHSFLVYWLKF